MRPTNFVQWKHLMVLNIILTRDSGGWSEETIFAIHLEVLASE